MSLYIFLPLYMYIFFSQITLAYMNYAFIFFIYVIIHICPRDSLSPPYSIYLKSYTVNKIILLGVYWEIFGLKIWTIRKK